MVNNFAVFYNNVLLPKLRKEKQVDKMDYLGYYGYKYTSRSMITFIILNTSGFTIIPTTIIALRMYHNSINPSSIVLACFITSFLSVICGLLVDRLFARRNHD